MQVTREYADKHLNQNEIYRVYFPNKKEWMRQSRIFWKFTLSNVLVGERKMLRADYNTPELRNYYNFLYDNCIDREIKE